MSTIYDYLTGPDAPPYDGGYALTALVRAPGLKLGQVFAGCASYYAYIRGNGAYVVAADIRCPAARHGGAMLKLGQKFAPIRNPNRTILSNTATKTAVQFRTAYAVRDVADWVEPNLARVPRAAATRAWIDCVRVMGYPHTRAERERAVEALRAANALEPPAPLAAAAAAWVEHCEGTRSDELEF